eukprot:6665970-Pyramimonas_sp.AAC.1
MEHRSQAPPGCTRHNMLRMPSHDPTGAQAGNVHGTGRIAPRLGGPPRRRPHSRQPERSIIF